MRPSARDKRIRIAAGWIIIALSVLPVALPLLAGRFQWNAASLAILGCQVLMGLGAGLYLALGRGKAGTLVMVRGRWRRFALPTLAVVGIAAMVLGFLAGPEATVAAATWPLMMAMWILGQFRSNSRRFQHTEQWITALPPETALHAVVRAFSQPGLRTRSVERDVWVEIGRNWTGGAWFHGSAANHLKTTTEVHFHIDDANGRTRITAHSGDRTVMGMYDVLKLSDEMSATAVVLAREVTPPLHEGPHS